MMSEKANTIKERYGKSYVTDEQLDRYRILGVITLDEYKKIVASKKSQEKSEESDLSR